MIGYIILSIFCLTLSYIVFNLMGKVERLETWIEGYVDRINETQSTLKEIDDKGTIQADDEIGLVFTSIKESVDEINEITEQEL